VRLRTVYKMRWSVIAERLGRHESSVCRRGSQLGVTGKNSGPIPEELLQQAIAYINEGRSNPWIAKKMNFDIRRVQGIRYRAKRNGSVTVRKARA
jgi:hypothetical protein